MSEKSSEQLHREWLEHRFFRYRGCAPHPDAPKRMAGDPDLPVGAHHGPDAWAPESQQERRAREARALEVCLNCPVMVACDAYASSVTAEGKLAQPDGVWGGRLGLERRRAFDARARRVAAAADGRFQTPQKQAVLRALAACWDPFEVAERAGVDVRTANWQRSNLVTLLGLPRKATRARLLAAAAERGLLEGVAVVADDGTVPAVPPPTKTKQESSVPQLAVVAAVPALVPVPERKTHRARVRKTHRARVTVPLGQLSLEDVLLAVPEPGLELLGAAA